MVSVPSDFAVGVVGVGGVGGSSPTGRPLSSMHPAGGGLSRNAVKRRNTLSGNSLATPRARRTASSSLLRVEYMFQIVSRSGIDAPSWAPLQFSHAGGCTHH